MRGIDYRVEIEDGVWLVDVSYGGGIVISESKDAAKVFLSEHDANDALVDAREHDEFRCAKIWSEYVVEDDFWRTR